MKTKLERLQNDAGKLQKKLAQVDSELSAIRARMAGDPLNARGPAQQAAALAIEAEVLTTALNAKQADIETELNRLNSNEVQKAVKRAEKLGADIEGSHRKIVDQARAILADIEAAGAKYGEITELLRQADQEPGGMLAGKNHQLKELAAGLSNWLAIPAGSAYTEAIKKMQADKAERKAVQEAEQARAMAAAEAQRKAEAAREKASREAERRAWQQIGKQTAT